VASDPGQAEVLVGVVPVAEDPEKTVVPEVPMMGVSAVLMMEVLEILMVEVTTDRLREGRVGGRRRVSKRPRSRQLFRR